MDTKEKTRTRTPAGRKRPGRPAQPTKRRAPAASRQAAQPSADDEVFIPDAESQEQRHRTAGAGENLPVRRTAAPPRSRKEAAKAAAKKQRGKEAGYRPYQKANARQKAVRRQSVRDGVQKFFSYQNPVARLFNKEDPSVFGDDANAVRKAKRAAELAKKRKRDARLKTPATMYIQPATFNSHRLAIQLITVLAVVLSLVLGMSVFFRVENITVSGANVYSPWNIQETSGIQVGDNLLTFGRTKACGKIIANLPYVKSARIGIKLPNTVIIEIEEEAVVYSIQDQDGVWWLINSDGKVVEQTSAISARSYTQVLGVTLYMPQAGEAGVATEELPTQTDAAGELVPVMITGAQRLNSALRILQALEDNDIVGDAASVDVSQLQDIILWYGTQYQVNLGTIDRITYKITYMKDAIMQMSDYQTGILDVSFTTWPDMAGYTPFG